MQSDLNTPNSKSSYGYIKTNQSINFNNEDLVDQNKIIIIDEENKQDIQQYSPNLEIIKIEEKELKDLKKEDTNGQKKTKSKKKIFFFVFLSLIGLSLLAIAIFFFFKKTDGSEVNTNMHILTDFEKLVIEKNPEEPVLVRNFAIDQSLTYSKISKNEIFNSTNPNLRNTTYVDSSITYHILEIDNKNFTKIFFSLNNVTQREENKNSTILVYDSNDLYKSKNFLI